MAVSRNGTMGSSVGQAKRVLVAGGGVAALEAMLALRSLGEARLRVELVAPVRDFIYRPLAVAEPFGLGAGRRFDLKALAAGVGAGYRVDALGAIDPERHLIHTRAGFRLGYDALLIAIGGRMREAIRGAITFWGHGDAISFRALLKDLATGAAKQVVFCVPGRNSWPLPLYELALMSAAYPAQSVRSDPEITIATPETRPLELFGPAASAAVQELLEKRGIGLCCGCYPVEVDGEGVRLVPGGHLAADRVVATPRLEGPFCEGAPHDQDGFIPTDSFGRVRDLEDADVYAAGDVTSFPVKQGGLAAQQADAVAELIAAKAGVSVDPSSFRPVLRGLLLTGFEPNYLRAEISGGRGETSVAASEALWWPPSKIAGKYLAPHLSRLAKTELQPPPVRSDGVPIEIELSR